MNPSQGKETGKDAVGVVTKVMWQPEQQLAQTLGWNNATDPVPVLERLEMRLFRQNLLHRYSIPASYNALGKNSANE